MTSVQRAAEVRGKTIRFTWYDGPTQGKTHEHTFHEDGTVEWRDADASTEKPRPGAKTERVEYAAMKVSDTVYLVSYLSQAGYTLTVALNFDDNSITAVASGAKEWHPIRGTFAVVGDS